MFFLKKALATTYFPPLLEGYHRRWCVSRLCSEWEEVVPHRFSYQGRLYYNRLS